MGWHPLVDTETRRRPMLSLGARGAAVGFLVVDPVKKRGSGGVLDLKVVTPFKVIPVKKVDVINATSSGPSVIRYLVTSDHRFPLCGNCIGKVSR